MERSCRSDTILDILHEVGLRRCRGRFQRHGSRTVHHQRGQLPVRQCYLVLLRPGNQTGAERNLLPCQRHETRRRGTVDDHLRQQGLGRGEQLPRDFRHRPEHLQGGRTHREPDLTALHSFPKRRKSIRHPIVGQPHLHHQPEEIRNYRLYSSAGHDDGKRLDGANGAVRQIRLLQLLELPEPHHQNRHRNRSSSR